MKKPDNNKPKLNNGATSLLMECPKSLRALLVQLNHGEKIMAITTKKIAVKGPSKPKRA